MGAVYHGVCYGSGAEAALALCAKEYPRIESGKLVGCNASAGNSITVGSGTVTSTIPVAFGGCNENEQFEDITALWGLAVLCLATIWCLREFILRQVANQ